MSKFFQIAVLVATAAMTHVAWAQSARQPDLQTVKDKQEADACAQQVISSLPSCKPLHCDYHNYIMEMFLGLAPQNAQTQANKDALHTASQSYYQIQPASSSKCAYQEKTAKVTISCEFTPDQAKDFAESVQTGLTNSQEHHDYAYQSGPNGGTSTLDGKPVRNVRNEYIQQGICKVQTQ